MQVVLAMFRSDGDRRSFSLHKEITIVGRREDCDLRIPLGEISRKHCKITKDGENLKVEDLGSSNGTFHNGQRVQEAVVQPGDTVQVGSVAFVVQIDGTPGDDDMQPILAQKAVAADDSAAPAASDSDASGAVVDGSADSDVAPAAEDSGAPAAAGTESGGEAADGDFDPMAFLEAGDSQSSGGALAMDMDQSGPGMPAEED